MKDEMLVVCTAARQKSDADASGSVVEQDQRQRRCCYLQRNQNTPYSTDGCLSVERFRVRQKM